MGIESTVRYKPELESRYTNYFQVGHNSAEVVVDFGWFYVDEAGPTIHTRIATTPVYAKALLDTLQDAIRTYERTFGVIPAESTRVLE
jgi:hypothetical protein